MNSREIILLDRKNGWVKKKIKIENYNFFLNHHTNRIVSYTKHLNQVVSYDFDGKSQAFDINKQNTKSSIELVDCLNEKFLFKDSNLEFLYVS